jgi:hypothetical protein
MQRVFVNDHASALGGVRGRFVRFIATVAMSPGSTGFQPAQRNDAGKMPALPGEASLFTNGFSDQMQASRNPMCGQSAVTVG